MSDKRNKLHLPDILFGKRKDEPEIDPDDIVEVYGPAEMLGTIGSAEDLDPEDPDDASNEDEGFTSDEAIHGVDAAM